MFGLNQKPAAPAQAETEAAPSAPRRGRKVTKAAAAAIRERLGKMKPYTKEYKEERDRLCAEFKLKPRQVSGVLAGDRRWAARRSRKRSR